MPRAGATLDAGRRVFGLATDAVDGLLLGYSKLVTLPTIPGGNLFIHTVDIHYQSTGRATKNKSPNFDT